MNKIEVYLLYRKDEDFWRSFITLGEKLSNIKQELLTTSDKESAPFPSAIIVFGKEMDLSMFGFCVKGGLNE